MERVIVEELIGQAHLFAALGHDAQRRLGQHRGELWGLLWRDRFSEPMAVA